MTNFIFATGYGTIAHYTSKLLAAIADLDRPARRVELPAIAHAAEMPVVVGTVLEGEAAAGGVVSVASPTAIEVRPQEAVTASRAL